MDEFQYFAFVIRHSSGHRRRFQADSPSMRRLVGGFVADETRRSAKQVSRSLALFDELPRVSIDRLTFTDEQVLGDWFPDASPATP